MKIAFVLQPADRISLPVEGGSIPIWTYQVARRLAPHDDVLVYAASDAAFGRTDRRFEDVTYRFLPKFAPSVLHKAHGLSYRVRALLPTYRPDPRHPRYASALNGLGYALQVATDLRRRHCDVVHVHNHSQLVPVIRALNPEVRIVLHMSCEWLTQLDPGMIDRRLRACDLILGCSDYITGKIRRAFPQHATRCETVYYGVDTDHFSPAAEPGTGGDHRLLFVSRISPEKGVHVLLDAVRLLTRQGMPLHLDIVGSLGSVAPRPAIVGLSDDPKVQALATFYTGDGIGEDRYGEHLHAQVADGMSETVTFCGGVPHSDVVDAYRRAHLLVAPSLSEAFGMSLVEAMSTGVPVAAARTGGMVDIVDEGRTGLLVAPGEARALAEGIRSLLEDEPQRRAMAAAARDRVLALFSWDRVAESLRERYQDVRSVRWEPSFST